MIDCSVQSKLNIDSSIYPLTIWNRLDIGSDGADVGVLVMLVSSAKSFTKFTKAMPSEYSIKPVHP